MNRKLKLPILALLAAFAAGQAFADHGALGSTQRDAWINDGLRRLVGAGYLPEPSTPFDSQTNLEAAESVARASERLLAQLPDPGLPLVNPPDNPSAPAPEAPVPAAAPSSPAPMPVAGTPLTASPDLQRLVLEYRKELTALGVDVSAVEKRLKGRKGIYDKMAAEQEKSLTRTGSDVGVYSRGYFDEYQTFGPGANIQRDASNFNDIRFRSVPVPKLLFEASVRIWGTYGFYFVDPVQKFEWRTLRLTGYTKYADLQVGDLFMHLTPLTMWNYTPVFTFLEPRPFRWTRTDREEIMMLDQGNDWHLRGFKLDTHVGNDDSKVLNKLYVKAAGGPVKLATTGDFANYWASAQTGADLFGHKAQLQVTGLRLWDDLNSAPVPYVDNFPKTWAQLYEIGSANPKLSLPLSKEVTLSGDWEGTFSRYRDDRLNGNRDYQDWASRATGSLDLAEFTLSGKVLNVGPNFYSPGAQTLRYSPAGALGLALPLGYETGSEGRDLSLSGYRNRFLFSDIGRPSFAPYDRLDEAIFPYGDATPNRQGFVAGASAAIGTKGWVKPKFSYTKANEIKPNWVMVPQAAPTPDVIVAVDSGTASASTRSFKSLDGALELDLAAVLQKRTTLALGGEYKSQESDLDSTALKVNTVVAYLDVMPPVKWLKWADMTFAFRQVKSQGSEYGLGGTTLADYAFYPVATDLGNYVFQTFDITRTELAFGMQYKPTKLITIRGDWIANTTKTETTTGTLTTRGQVWRMMYEASF